MKPQKTAKQSSIPLECEKYLTCPFLHMFSKKISNLLLRLCMMLLLDIF